MSCDELVDEDLLIPLGGLDQTMFAFHRAEGTLWEISDRSLRGPVALEPGSFALSGQPVVHRAVPGAGSVVVHLIDVLPGPTLSERSESISVATAPSDRFISLVQAPRRGFAVVVKQADGRLAVLDPTDGGRRLLDATDRARVCAVWSDGSCVIHDDDGWRLDSDAMQRSGTGRIVSTYTDRFIVQTEDKAVRRFWLWGPSAGELLEPPPGWAAVQAACDPLGFIMTVVHPEFGYATWDGGELVQRDGMLQLFPIGDGVPVVRQTGSALGSSWWRGRREIGGMVQRRDDIVIQVRIVTGLPTVLLYRSRGRRHLLVTLHGGPDSNEWDDLRHGGLYRRLVDDGWDVLIVNYSGSRGFGEAFQKRAWGRWGEAVAGVVDAVRHVEAERPHESIVLFGVSFGAWLGAQALDALSAAGVFASPVLGLRAHLEAHAGDPEFDSWARDRFGRRSTDVSDGDAVVATGSSRAFLVLGREDEVVDHAETKRIAVARGWTVTEVQGTHHPNTRDAAHARWAAIHGAVAAARDALVSPDLP